MFSECQNKSQSLHFSRSNHRKNANRVSLTFGVIHDFISKYLEIFDEKPKKIARLESGESSIVPNEEKDHGFYFQTQLFLTENSRTFGWKTQEI